MTPLLMIPLFTISALLIDALSFTQRADAFCGDGVKEEDEECDDGNSIGFDTCNNFCVQGLDIQMISIPAGNFLMGSDRFEKDEQPEHLVKLKDNFLFSKTEVTHRQYRACVEAGDCSLPATATGCVWGTENTDDHPINCVNWRQAQEFANFVGLRLPTEAEWEYVASSADQRVYPWGDDEPSCDYLVSLDCAQTTQPVCLSDDVPRPLQLENQAFEICDLAGNVAEWIEDNYAPNYNDASVTGAPFETRDRRLKFYRVLRGGAWLSTPSQYRVTDRYARLYVTQRPDSGIRLAKSTLCGNGVVNQDFDGDGEPDTTHPDFEECDDGNLINSDGCDSNCTVTGCGNGIVNKDFDQDGIPDQQHPLFEYCDIRPVNGRACLEDCTIDACGDGVVQAQFGEQCDDGDDNSDELPNACRLRCRNAFCGDGVTDDGEECDNGLDNSDDTPNACRTDCTLPSCGDDVIDAGEQCDNGASNSDVEIDACRTNCIEATCGDGVQDTGEACDDGFNNSNLVPNACRETCVEASCGDGVQDDGEACDDGDGIDTNACLNSCEVARCGDNIRRTDILPGNPGYEACDDGNDESKDRCLNTCALSACGDGVIRDVNINPGELGFEVCDDGNDNDDDGCSSGCAIEADYTCLGEPSNCFFDEDQDQIPDVVDNCLGLANNDQADGDLDGVGDACDNCPVNFNPDQQNTDQELALANGVTVPDQEGDVCDSDDDNDSVLDFDDDLPLNPFVCSDTDNDTCDDCAVLARRDISNDGLDTDGDIICNAGDLDDDDDEFSDLDEATCGSDPLDDSSVPLDTDADGLCDDGVDLDDDNDNVSDIDEDANNNGQYDVGLESDPKNPDTDGDGTNDDTDNCLLTPNEDQLNTDLTRAAGGGLVPGDALGDACDDDDDNDLLTDAQEDINNNGQYDVGVESDPKNPDTDGDFRIDGDDNCILTDNQDQQNTDQELVDDGETLIVGDTFGDACDDDDDNDGLTDTVELLQSGTSPFLPDHDGDGVIDSVDNCRLVPNADQTNTDRAINEASGAVSADAEGDACDADDDNDTIIDQDDNAPLNPFRCQDADQDGCDDCSQQASPNILNDGLDTDGDNICNVGDLDDDGDGFSDLDETTCGSLPLIEDSTPLDTDDDGLCDDGVDDDDDDDGLTDAEEDTNNNGRYDNGLESDPKNPDTDGDGTNDNTDNCLLIPNEDQLNTDKQRAAQGGIVLGDELGDACDDNDDNDLLTDVEEDANNNGQYDVGVESDPKNPDTDGDFRIDGNDNCILVSNQGQQNTDQELVDGGETLIVGDANGDACDDDDDNDGLTDSFELLTSRTSPFLPDHDGDGVIDSVDNCRLVQNPDQVNTDETLNQAGGVVPADPDGDACDNDDDNDTVIDPDDDDPKDPFRCQDADQDGCDDCSQQASPNIINDGFDHDGDNICDVGDLDDDDDGFSDADEATCGTLPRNDASVPLDTDGDGLCDNGVDLDDDNDGVSDADEDANNNNFYDVGIESDPKNPDTDGDGTNDDTDNCLLTPNPDQLNSDALRAAQGGPVPGDPLGDACDDNDDNDLLTDLEEDANNNGQYDEGVESDPKNPDTDGDSRLDGADNCILRNNPAQQNTDKELVEAGETLIVGDELGDECDDDDDNDGLVDAFELFTSQTNPYNPDHDGDEILDSLDNCPLLFNPNQINTDKTIADQTGAVEGDDIGDACDSDDDNDTVFDNDDDDPLNPFVCLDADQDGCDDCSQQASPNIINDGLDTDADQICNLGDLDDDGDGYSDADEQTCGSLSLNSNSKPLDTDQDGLCDNGVDPDDDNDNLLDTAEDADGDGFYDVGVETNFRDADTDNDGTNDDEDNCPVIPNADQLNTDALIASQPNSPIQGDGFGDICDDDDDNDGLTDQDEDTNNNGRYDEGIETNPKNPDTDGDSSLDNIDNCPLVNNPGQQNTDQELVDAGETLIVGDELGDSCDTDDDNDGFSDTHELLTSSTNPFNPDHDNDNVLDSQDNCPLVFNPGQTNTDVTLAAAPGALVNGDAEGDACDGDDDNDTVIDQDDIAPLDPFSCSDFEADGCDDCSVEAQPNVFNDGPDLDGDRFCDASDDDDDGDGFSDDDEGVCGTNPRSAQSVPLDTDRDGLCDDGVDNDDDNDNLLDTAEDANGNNQVDQGETNPKLRDSDSDGVDDDEDNCPVAFNADQLNTDANLAQQPNSLVNGDELGDVCDNNDDNDLLTDNQEDTNNNDAFDPGLETNPKNPDTDGDSVLDGADNCPFVVNPDQANSDKAIAQNPDSGIVGDELGDACDSDDDNDGLSDAQEIAQGTLIANPDSDGDGELDNVDNCPTTPNPDQTNTDGDAEGDACDSDDDNDTVPDNQDLAPLNSASCRDDDADQCDDCAIARRPEVNNDGLDTDGDGDCNEGDTDDDNDGFSDAHESVCGTDPKLNNSVPVDTDGDGLCDAGIDDDDDNDTLPDAQEDPVNVGVLDPGETNPLDPDTDDDGVRDDQDNCPRDPNPNQVNTDANLALQPNALINGDSLGDVCDDDDDNDGLKDSEEDLDGDGAQDVGETRVLDPDTDDDNIIDGVDNCPLRVNPDQADNDIADGEDGGDACDDDDDNDGLTDSQEVNLGTSPFDSNSDDDLFLDGNDNCPLTINNNQTDTDGDGIGNACDLDDDNDTVSDNDDLDPLNKFSCEDEDNDGCDDCAILGQPNVNNDGFDRDGDGICDIGDPDEDADGFTNIDEIKCGSDPENNASRPLDTDGDGLCDNGVDDDDDNDGLTDLQEDVNNNGQQDPGETDPKDRDSDDDGDVDNVDNCPLVFNPNQFNTDQTLSSQPNALIVGDALGDACDDDDDNDNLTDQEEAALNTNPLNPDSDGDQDIDGLDNCPLTPNANQLNSDGADDGGNACDDDDDNDGLTDAEEADLGTNPVNPNTDGDAHNDAADNCPLVFNNNQTNTDGADDGGDACDADDDNDGVEDGGDANSTNPLICRDLDGDGCDDCSVAGQPQPNNDGDDHDGDGQCDASDLDDDNDGFSDADEQTCGTLPRSNASVPSDFDGDGLCDNGVDPDDDNDSVADVDDNRPLDRTRCRDLDFDLCDDCSSGTDDPANDGPDLDGDGFGDDFDGDGKCDFGDLDDDDDGVEDTVETECDSDPLNFASRPVDTDGDTVCDALDKCADIPDNQSDRDGDGEGDACDCGDGVADGDGEQCDAGENNTVACDSDCTLVVCGDAHVNPVAGEQCDEGNNDNSDDCVDGPGSSCTIAFCGDGFLRTNASDPANNEQCDDGNANNGDGCDSNCKIEVCGNGIVQTGEQCDDGDQLTDDECIDGANEACTNARCGDGFLLTNSDDPARIEECDDGNTINGDGCDDQCKYEAPCFEADACPEIDYRFIAAGAFTMGDNNAAHTSPEHIELISEFHISRTEVTVGQYRACVDNGPCSAPTFKTNQASKSNYQLADENPGRPNAEDYPMNLIDWEMSRTFAAWVGARLPSEAEWEYAATSQGLDHKYAWGNGAISCQLAVYRDSFVDITREGCGERTSLPVCSRSTLGPVTGETQQGLCDMNGNLEEWVEDRYVGNYNDAHGDGSPYDYDCNPDPAVHGIACFERSLRGGSYTFLEQQITNRQRQGRVYVNTSLLTGFRIVKTVP